MKTLNLERRSFPFLSPALVPSKITSPDGIGVL